MKLDPVLLEILANKVQAAADEMATTLQRTSRTLYVKEAADFATGLVNLEGKLFAHPKNAGVTIFVDADCKATIEAVPDLEPGDVILTNDPFSSGGLSTHLPDLHFLQPVFHRGRIVCYLWNFIHSSDIGGRVPGSISPSCRELFQEGLIIPPMKFVERGRINEDLLAFYKANCRTPEDNMGDIRAMLASLRTGEERITGIIERHGVDVLLAAQNALLDYSEAKARAVFRRIPDGAYEFWEYIDDDMVSTVPVRVRVRLTARDGSIHLDLTGTDPQVDSAYNVASLNRCHEWLTLRLSTFVLTHDKTVPLNAGIYRPITITNPEGTVVNVLFPGAVGNRSISARRVNDAVTGCILKAAPELIAAPTCGASTPFALAEHDPLTGARIVQVVEPLRGGMGALKGQDGVDGRDASMSNMRNHPLEDIEAACGVVVREYDVRPDSGGAGQWRGGNGQMITVEIVRDGGVLMARGMERLRFVPWGVAGAKPAKPFRAVLNWKRPGEKDLTKIDELPVSAGDLVTFMMPGAAGVGDPFARDPQKVREDVELGFVSREAARTDYGVAVGEDFALDVEETRRLRAQRVRDNRRAAFDFGAERDAWESVFDDETMLELNRRLFALPLAARYDTRRRIFERTIPNLPRAGEATLVEVIKDPDAARRRLRDAMRDAFGEAAD